MAKEMIKEYFSGQGEVELAPFLGGVVKPHKARWVGNVPSLELSTEVETDEHLESHTGARSPDRVREKTRKITFKMTLEDYATLNLQMAFQASLTAVPKGKVTDLVSPEDLAVGDSWQLGKIKVSSVVLTDSTTSPKTLQAGVNYRIDEAFGIVEPLDLSGLKLPLKATFDHESANVLNLLMEKTDGYYLRFKGLNTENNNEPVLVEIHKAKLSPAKTWALINEDLASFEIEGTALMHNGQMVTVTKA